MDFRGFMIQGRARADNSPVGSFDVGTGYQPQCSGDVSYLIFRMHLTI